MVNESNEIILTHSYLFIQAVSNFCSNGVVDTEGTCDALYRVLWVEKQSQWSKNGRNANMYFYKYVYNFVDNT